MHSNANYNYNERLVWKEIKREISCITWLSYSSDIHHTDHLLLSCVCCNVPFVLHDLFTTEKCEWTTSNEWGLKIKVKATQTSLIYSGGIIRCWYLCTNIRKSVTQRQTFLFQKFVMTNNSTKIENWTRQPSFSASNWNQNNKGNTILFLIYTWKL